VNLLKSKLRRTSTVAAGTFLGLVGMMATATPALACHTDVVGKAVCISQNGDWVVKWKLHNSQYKEDGTITSLSYAPETGSLSGIAVGATVPKKRHGGVLEGLQTVPAGASEATLQVTVNWQDISKVKTDSGKVRKPNPNRTPVCKPTSPSPSPSASESSSPSPSPSVSESSSPSPSPSVSESNSPSPSPSDSTPPTQTPPSSEEPEVPVKEPQFVYSNDCDTFTVGIEIPASWPEDITVTFTPSVGEPKTVVGKVGETTTVDFPATEGLKVTATPEGYEDEAAEIAYETPEDCDTDGEGGGLPVTGAAAGGIAGGAAALLGLGALLFFLARRRKVKFTA
jgi:hypothetical protein